MDINELRDEPSRQKIKYRNDKLTDYILDEFHVKVTRDKATDIYIYDGGIYNNNGELKIAEKLIKIMEKEFGSNYLREVLLFIRSTSEIKIEREELIANLHLLCMKNGILNTKTMKMQKHNPEIVLISKVPIDFNPKSKCPQWEKFLTEVVSKEDAVILQEAFGYCLLRSSKYQKAFMLTGVGSNGKSVLLDVLKDFLGIKNVTSSALQVLSDKFVSSRFYNKLANIYPDLPSYAIKDTGMFKALTGCDFIEAERKYGHPFTFTNHAKMFYSANRVPLSKDDSEAYFRRWIQIDFPNKFEGKSADKNLTLKLLKEKSGIFNWALKGLKRLEEEQIFSYSKTTQETRLEMIKKSHPLKAFIEFETIYDFNFKISNEDLYNAIIEYCGKNTLEIPTQQYVTKNIMSLCEGKVKPYKSGSERGYQGLRLKEKKENELNDKIAIEVLGEVK